MKKKNSFQFPSDFSKYEGFLITERKDFWGWKVLSFSKGQNFNALWGIRFWVEKSLVKRKKASLVSPVSPKGGNRKKLTGNRHTCSKAFFARIIVLRDDALLSLKPDIL